MKTLTQPQSSALVAFLEQTLQCLAVGGGKLTGPALVDAIEPGVVDPQLAGAYLTLRAKSGL